MSVFVLDASYALTWCFPDRATPNTDATLKRMEALTDSAGGCGQRPSDHCSVEVVKRFFPALLFWDVLETRTSRRAQWARRKIWNYPKSSPMFVG